MEFSNNKSISDLTLLELNVLINKTVDQHNNTKDNISLLIEENDKINDLINSKVDELKKIEDEYIRLVTELNNR